MTQAPSFRQGADAAKEASKGGGQFARTNFFKLDDGKKAVVRFLTEVEDWLVADQHQFIPTKGKPEGFEGNWPDKMGAVCRRDPAFANIYSDCYICDHLVDGKKVKKPSGRTWALACLREEVIEDGKLVGYRDQTRDIAKLDKEGKPTGETFVEKDIVVVNMGWKNFFSTLQGYGGHYGSIRDRDYLIERSGDDTSTTYSIIPLDPIDTDKGRFGPDHPDWEQRYKTDIVLWEVLAERASDEFYARFFDPRYTATDDGVKPTGAEPQAKPDHDADEERVKQLAERVRGYAKPDGEAVQADKSEGDKAPATSGIRDFG